MPSPSEGSDAWAAQDKGPAIVVVCWAVTGVGTVFVLARLLVRVFIWRRLQSDDYYVTTALICGYISTALSTIAVSYGNGKHYRLLTTEQKEKTILYTIAAFCPGVLSFGLPKMAVISLLARLLNPSELHKWVLYFIGTWCMLTLFATCGVLLGQCSPAASLWDFSIEGTCIPKYIVVAYCQYAGAFSAFVDAYLAAYPTIVLHRLQMPIRKKVALCCALGIGFISAVVAVYKTTRIQSLGSADFSYDTSDLVVWTVIEGNTIIIACSLPILQPLLEILIKSGPFTSKRSKMSLDQRELGQGGPVSSVELDPFYKLKRSKKRDNLGLTTYDDEGSQENILCDNTHADANAVQGAHGSSPTIDDSPSYLETRPPEPDHTGEAWGIRKTQHVSISYSTDGCKKDRDLGLKSIPHDW